MHTSSSSNPSASASSSITAAPPPSTTAAVASSTDPTSTTTTAAAAALAMHHRTTTSSRHYHHTLLPPAHPLPSKTLRTSAIPKPISKPTTAGSRKRALVDITNAHLSSTQQQHHAIGSKAVSGRVVTGKHGTAIGGGKTQSSKIPLALGGGGGVAAVKRQAGMTTTNAGTVTSAKGMLSSRTATTTTGATQANNKSSSVKPTLFNNSTSIIAGGSSATANAKQQQQQQASEQLQQQPQRRASRRIAARRARHVIPSTLNTTSTSTATASAAATRSSATVSNSNNSTAAAVANSDATSMLPIDRVARAVQTIKVDSATTSFAAARRRAQQQQQQQDDTMRFSVVDNNNNSNGNSMNTDIMSMTMSVSTVHTGGGVAVPSASAGTNATGAGLGGKIVMHKSSSQTTNAAAIIQQHNTGRHVNKSKSNNNKVDEDGDVNLDSTQVDDDVDVDDNEEDLTRVVSAPGVQQLRQQQSTTAGTQAKQHGVSRSINNITYRSAMLDDVVHDIDVDDHSNCLTASAFAVAAHDNLRRSEESFYISSPSQQPSSTTPPSSGTTTTANATISSPPTYARQSQISDRMRVVLLDWLVDVHHKHRLRSETLFLTVSVLDRVLHRLPVARRTFQLVGMVSLWIASKFEDNIPPEVSDLVYVCDGAYSRGDVIREEARLLNVVEFKLNVPTILPFLRRAIKAAAKAGRFPSAEIEEDVSCLARYLSEIALFCSGTRGVRPSLVAAAALSLAMRLLQVDLPWGRHMTNHTGWAKRDFEAIEEYLMQATRDEAAKTTRSSQGKSTGHSQAQQQQHHHHQTDKLSALRRKFNSPRYCHIASRLPGLVVAAIGGKMSAVESVAKK